jgi:shikimate kinase
MGEHDNAERHVVLVGLMGVGKSTVGRRLAKEMERPFADADEQVELRAGRAIPAIFRTGGEDEFRRLETEVLSELVTRPCPLVVAAGGGAVSRAQNREILAPRSFVVWLRASAEFLVERTDTAHRPLLADDAHGTLRRLLIERTPLYEGVSDAIVDVEPFHDGGDKPKRAIARHIVSLARAAGAHADPANAEQVGP